MERKTFQTAAIKLDEAQGIVEHIIAVMGNLDMGNDIIHPGAFAKTISERGTKVRVLDAHNTDSIMRVLGKPRSMREIGKHELPSDLLMKYPDANGALLVETQYLMNTPEGKGAFERIQSGAVDEYSIGYDPLDFDYSDVVHDGKKVTARNLRTLKLYEYSPVLWGMNSATATLSAKEKPSEEKPWNVFKEDGKWRVYKLGANDKPTGEALGEHDTEEEARVQMRALYANEGKEDKAPMKTEEDGKHPAGHYLVVEDPEKVDTWHLRVRGMDGKPDHRLMGGAWAALHGGYRGNVYEGPGKQEAIRKLRAMYEAEDMPMPDEGEKEMTPQGPIRRLGDVLQGSIHQAFTMMTDSYYIDGLLNREERIMLSSLIGDALDILSRGIPEDIAMRPLGGVGMHMMNVPIYLESKTGRVLAARNATRIVNAMNLLHEALTDAGLMEPMMDEEETNAPEGAAKNKQQDTGAGPPVNEVHDAPTQEDMLTLIELGLAEINLLEV